MASFLTQLFSNSSHLLRAKYIPLCVAFRNTANKPKKKPARGTTKQRHLIKADCESLGARGFLRFQKPYTPASDVVQRVKLICENVLGPKRESDSSLSIPEKYSVLTACFEELKHTVPNSSLHKIDNIKDIIEFYQTPVSTSTPFDDLKKMELPPNLIVQPDAVRFHPETDTLFKGITAYPYSSTIVSGIRYKKKYRGLEQKLPFYYDNWADYVINKEEE